MYKFISDLVGRKISICHGEEEIIKDIIINQISAPQQIPPYDHFVYSFLANCNQLDFSIYDNKSLAKHKPVYTVKVDNISIPVYIDFYEIFSEPIGITDMSGSPYSLIGNTDATVSGHFDSRDFDASSPISVIVEGKINSRFEILDL